ncbi:hypothetical protein M436DRAFT_83800 [Aureobasidium namibiae CBS 147.97]|uniref:Uncharacterized protein n=1 Tax=Aureobasidium namibiae CBS 147.97 TaxID=1043004 RepID=A0A074WP83_9PEZI
MPSNNTSSKSSGGKTLSSNSSGGKPIISSPKVIVHNHGSGVRYGPSEPSSRDAHYQQEILVIVMDTSRASHICWATNHHRPTSDCNCVAHALGSKPDKKIHEIQAIKLSLTKEVRLSHKDETIQVMPCAQANVTPDHAF